MGSFPTWASNLNFSLIERLSWSHGIDPFFVAAVVQTESAGNPNAVRYEPSFKHTFDLERLAKVASVTVETMRILQSSSWGLMQVMGSVAYEHGLERENTWHRRIPSALCIEAMGLNYGCKHLRLKSKKFGSDPATLYAAYNAGSIIRRADTGELVNKLAVERFMSFFEGLKR